MLASTEEYIGALGEATYAELMAERDLYADWAWMLEEGFLGRDYANSQMKDPTPDELYVSRLQRLARLSEYMVERRSELKDSELGPPESALYFALYRRLKAVPQSYAAFVSGIMADAREFNTADRLVSYIDEHPDATAGDISTYSGRLAGLIDDELV